MNYLAHIYLSGNDTELRIGNFIADSVRGKDFTMFPERVAQGIILHRHIDTFTDSHPIVKLSKDLIRSEYGHWSSVIVDLYYDHFLAANWADFHKEPLDIYVEQFYSDLKENYNILPEKVQKFLPYMVDQNWISSYATVDGISRIFHQMNHRTKNRSKMNFAPIELVKYYNEMERHFREFFEDLEFHVKKQLVYIDNG
ncbi:MAG: acyl carrier protein phosphodiesterase [Nonlabens ulvanivorans]|uniref:Acyl carrier protein phosphodiesterase n=2 Tax=Nonlabens ulvanivorans TaxID=906888 RepID=A0A081DF34_NONUL|nr:acyl carrier protein phosphodiesterase [Nonlabens ulvanivorans]WOI23806.1 acyl carrier protein phosphodiesterase [Nonlabens ulvanivorans]GAK77530.1 acyl carrier protein phosphodiesterase [Nonlabens ulvanivorans]